MSGEIAARVIRGKDKEAVHNASVAVVNSEGELTHYLGDVGESWMTRSCVKPFQALPLLMSGGFDKFGFSERQLAIMCASHNGTDEHVEVTLSNLKLAGNSPDDLLCGFHLPTFMRLNELYPANEEDKDPLRHNCSGKHSGFLALAKFLDEPLAEYLNPNSKTQEMVRQSVADMCRYDVEKIKIGVDGCSAPVLSLPLQNIATGFARLATMNDEHDKQQAAVTRVRKAMYAHPYLISGEKRLDYDLMRSFPGNVVCKVGAEGIEGLGFREQGIGICVKIIDGNTRALGVVIVEVLKQLGMMGDSKQFPLLATHEKTILRNNRGIDTAKIIPDFKLKKVV